MFRSFSAFHVRAWSGERTHTTQIHINATIPALTDVPEVKPRPPMAMRHETMMTPPMSSMGRRPVFSTTKDEVKTMPIKRMLSTGRVVHGQNRLLAQTSIKPLITYLMMIVPRNGLAKPASLKKTRSTDTFQSEPSRQGPELSPNSRAVYPKTTGIPMVCCHPRTENEIRVRRKLVPLNSSK